MAGPFFRSHWDMPFYPRYSANMEASPVRRQRTPSPKVVSVPVQFVRSERSRSESALKIQKVFRGFLVRKSVKSISAIRNEVIEIEKRISKRETVELIRNNSKEQLKLNEMLMNLLFRLDSVKGVDCGVRDLRKAVTKKAIALQEKLDSLVAGDQILGAIDETLEASGNCDYADKVSDQITEITDSEKAEHKISGDVVDPACELQNHVEESMPISSESEIIPADGAQDSLVMAQKNTENVESMELQADVRNRNAESGIERLEKSVGTTEMESESSADEEGELEKQDHVMEIDKLEQNESKWSREILEKIMEDNGKMTGLMTQLYEKNEMQTQLLSSLSKRVDQLERALVNEKLRRKKKWQAAGLIDGFETPSDLRKCGKRQ